MIDDKASTVDARYTALGHRAFVNMELQQLAAADADVKSMFDLRTAPTGHFLRGRLLALQGRIGEARASYDTYVDTSNTKHAALCNRGLFKVRINDLEAAKADYSAAIAMDASKALAFVGRGIVFRRQNDTVAALQDFDRAAAAEPSFIGSYIERGELHLATSAFDKATADFNQALKLDEQSPRAIRGLAAAKANATAPAATPTVSPTGAPATATPAAWTTAPPPAVAATSTPVAPATLDQAAEIARLRSAIVEARKAVQWPEVIAAATSILKLAPTDLEAKLQRARALYRSNNLEAAGNDYDALYKDNAASAHMRASALEGFAQIMVRQRDWDRVLANANAAIELHPTLIDAYVWRGRARYERGDYGKAVDDFASARARQTNPKEIFYTSWAALGYVAIGDDAKANEAIAAIFAINPNAHLGNIAKGLLALSKGRVDAAEADFARAARGVASTPELVRAQQLATLHRLLKPTDQPLKVRP